MIEIVHKIKGDSQIFKADGNNEIQALKMFYEYLGRHNDKAHYHTGVKEADGIKKYKCRYFCECGNERNQYIELGTKEINCHSCDSIIDVYPAGKVDESGVPKRDKWGNFYIADGRT